jgi:malate synthase
VQYLGAWLGGSGAVPIFNLMEDAATAEISRAQVWQWIKSPLGVLEDGRKVTLGLFREVLGEELGKMQQDADPEVYANSKYPLAAEILDRITCNDIECEGKFSDFLTLPAYEYLE